MNCTVWFNGNTSAYMSNETLPFSRAGCSMKQESLPITDSKEEEKVRGEESKAFIKLLLKIPHSHWKPENKQRSASSICSWPTDPFFKTSMHYRKKNMLGNCNIFHYTPSLNYYIPKRLPQSPSYWAQPSFIVHGTSWNGAIVGLLSVFSFHPTKRKSSGPRQPSTIPAISWGTAAGRGGRATC